MRLTSERIYVNDLGPMRGHLGIERAQIEVTSLPGGSEPDPNWSMTDRAGHWHAASAAALPSAYPTLQRRTVQTPVRRRSRLRVPGFRPRVRVEDASVTREAYVCRICGEEIEPNRRIQSWGERRFVPGRSNWDVELAVPPIALAALYGLISEQATVRIEQPTGGQLFGVALVGNVYADVGQHATATLLGNGELGRTMSL